MLDEKPTQKPPKMGFEHMPAAQQARVGELLWDANAAGMKIVEFTSGRTGEAFEENEMLQAVVGKMLEILVGSLSELEGLAEEQAGRIDHLEAAIGLLPRMADQRIVWKFVEQKLPALLGCVTEQLEDWHQA